MVARLNRSRRWRAEALAIVIGLGGATIQLAGQALAEPSAVQPAWCTARAGGSGPDHERSVHGVFVQSSRELAAVLATCRIAGGPVCDPSEMLRVTEAVGLAQAHVLNREPADRAFLRFSVGSGVVVWEVDDVSQGVQVDVDAVTGDILDVRGPGVDFALR